MLLLAVLAMVATACSGGDDDGDESTEDGATEQVDEGTEDADTGADGGDGDVAQGGGTLAAVMDRGSLNCGGNDQLAGFGVIDSNGEFSGFDIDFCRAIAAALFDDPDALEVVPLTADVRFTALQSGEVDVLIRNTTWTATRDGSEGVQFGPTTFYDGQGMMVLSDSPYESIDDMNGTRICVLSGTTTELNLATQFEARGLDYEAVTFQDDNTLEQAFVSGQCDGWTSDKSGLAGRRSSYSGEGGPEALRILEDTMSKEPLGPGTLQGDDEWFDVVQWITFATIQAEEFGISSENLSEFLETDDPEIARFLGVGEEDFDPGLGLPSDFAQRIITHVGNYGEIYDRNVGPDTPLGLERGLNALWTDGGLLYAPPYR